ncbi:glycosyltransferase [Virgibacillus sp. JSM 102003]|uniref:glycosyltransferase n=1 Tax=Virgibacillus sp. JSM 102003 TaxID=1562108 RepID=UPI0035C1D2EC
MEKSKNRILVISNMYPGKQSNTYGIFVKNQVDAIKENLNDVDVVAVKDPRVGRFFVIKKYLFWLVQIMLILLLKGRKYDIVHAHYAFPSGLFGLVFKKIFGTKLVVTSHGGDIDKMSKKGPFIFNQTKTILKNTDSIIAVGEELKEEIIEKFGIEQDKIKVMNMGVNRDIFLPVDKDEAKEHLGIDREKFNLLYVGNYIEAKGLLELIEAYKNLKVTYPFLELNLIGSFKQESFRRKVMDKINIDEIEGITIHASKSQNEVAKWMAASDVFVLPSHIEGFGLVALEAMSTHTPVVGSDVGGLSYLLDNDAGILINAKDVTSLGKGIEEVINNKHIRQRLVQQGEIKAQENDQKQILIQLLKTYDDLYPNKQAVQNS